MRSPNKVTLNCMFAKLQSLHHECVLIVINKFVEMDRRQQQQRERHKRENRGAEKEIFRINMNNSGAVTIEMLTV